MRHFLVFVFVLFSVSCKSQNPQFNEYNSNFVNMNLPILLDYQTYNSVFNQNNGSYKEIPHSYVETFICEDNQFCKADPTMFRYDYGVKFKVLKNHIAVIIRKQQYEGTGDDYELTEYLLLIYNEIGDVISKLVIGKNNDRWMSSTKIYDQKIEVKQIKITESTLDKDELSCQIEEFIYQISSVGKIETVEVVPLQKGVLKWDEKTENFIMKK